MYNCCFVIYDLETGGLITKEKGIPPITEFACCILDNSLQLVEEVDFFIKPYRTEDHYTPKALEVSNITLDLCEKKGLTHQEASKKIVDVLKRAKDFLNYLNETYDNKKILIVSHGAFIKALYFNIVGYDEETDFLSFFPKNGEILEFEI